MISTRDSRGRRRCVLAAVLVCCLMPGLAAAESVAFRNECPTSVVVQVTSVWNRVVTRDQGLLRPGEATRRMPLTTDKVVTICCGQTGRILYRDILRASPVPVDLSIVPNRLAPGRVGLLKKPAKTMLPGKVMPGARP